MGQVWETGPGSKLVSTQVKDTRAKDLNDCKPKSKLGNQTFVVAVTQRKSGLVLVTRLEVNRGGA